MSERDDAPRSGDRARQSRDGATGRGRGDSRDARDRGTGARGVRQSAGSDTRRSGTRSESTRGDKARGEGTRAGSRSESVRGDKARSDSMRARGTRAGARSESVRGDKARSAGTRGGVLGGGMLGGRTRDRVTTTRGRGGKTTGQVEGTAALALQVSEPEVTAAAPQPAGRPRLWVAPPAPIRAPRVTFAAAVVAVVLLGVLGILFINTKTMEQSFRLDALRKEKAVLDKQQLTLEQQLIEASNPGNLHAAARRLGLVLAEDPAMIRLPDGKIIRPPTPGRGPVGPTAQDSPDAPGQTNGQTANGQTADVPNGANGQTVNGQTANGTNGQLVPDAPGTITQDSPDAVGAPPAGAGQ